MPDGSTPIQRSPQLAPLSREHHDGLLFGWKIKQGLSYQTAAERIIKYAAWYWQQHLKPHFFQEEQLLLPLFRPDEPLLVRMKKEHEQIRELILSLDTEADEGSLVALAGLLTRHIRFEERELFPFAEKNLTTGQLDALYHKMKDYPVCSDDGKEEWPDEFWLKPKE